MELKRKKIFIVDDEEILTLLVKWNLEETGEYKVTTESDPQKAITRALGIKPDLFLLDVLMPRMDGVQLARQIKANNKLNHIPIIYLSAALPDSGTAPQKDETDPYSSLAKPIGIKKLIEYINIKLDVGCKKPL